MLLKARALITCLLTLGSVNFIPRVAALQDGNSSEYQNETFHVLGQDPEEDSDNDYTWEYMKAYDKNELKDWSFCNYSSEDWCARRSIVEWGGKTYDPLSFKGGINNTYAVAFHLSTEIAVSAAQALNGTIFDVAKVDGSEAYKALMAQMQLDLKGDRSAYYALPYSRLCPPSISDSPFIQVTLFKPYFSRLYRYLTRNTTILPVTNPIPIFEEMLTSILKATEFALGAKLNTTSGHYAQDKIYMYISSPFALNHTYTSAFRCAMSHLHLRIHNGQYDLLVLPPNRWYSHSNDERDYSGDNGTKLAFEQARHNVAMSEFVKRYRPGDYRCGTGDFARRMKEVKEMKMNGTWVEPPVKGVLDFECSSWRQCWRTFVWQWDWDGAYDEFEFEGICQL